jgi:hypothetical protein
MSILQPEQRPSKQATHPKEADKSRQRPGLRQPPAAFRPATASPATEPFKLPPGRNPKNGARILIRRKLLKISLNYKTIRRHFFPVS